MRSFMIVGCGGSTKQKINLQFGSLFVGEMLRLILLAWALFSPGTVSGQSQCIDGSVRLVPLTLPGSNSRIDPNAGRFEICVGNQYGTVQVDSTTLFWSEKNALVACRQLGFEGALNSIPPSQLSSLDYASASVPVHYRSAMCLGTESSIANCSTRSSGTTHTTDVFLVCWPSGSIYTDLHSNTSSSTSTTIGSIRLVGESANGRGVVEILTGIGWSTICPDSTWTNDIATDMCQYLGYDSGTARTLSGPSSLVSPRLVRDPECSSVTQLATITRLDGGFCTFLESTSSTCSVPEGRYAAVTCTASRSTGSTRLFGLDTISSTRQQGAVEYFANGRWGVVCRPSSSIEVDESICDGFGYNRDESSLISISSTRIRMVESRMKPLWIPNMQCNAFDNSFSECSISRPLGYGTCGSTRDILVVDCGPKNRPFNSGYIAAIVVPTLIVIGIVIFLIIKKEEWLPQLKRHPCVQSLTECFTCQCWSPSPQSSRPVATHHQVVVAAPSLAPASVPPPASVPAPTAYPEPTLDNAELSKPPPPSYTTSFNLPNPNEDLPPPYFAHGKPSAPPPDAYSIPQGDPAYPPVNPAYPPGANAPYPTAPYTSDGSAPYPPGAPGAALPYPTSLAAQAYPPPPNVASNYPPATYPQ